MPPQRIELIQREDTSRTTRPLVESPPQLSSNDIDWSGFQLEINRTPSSGIIRRIESRHPLLTVCLEGSQQLVAVSGSKEYRTILTPGRVNIGMGGREVERLAWSGSQTFLAIELSPNTIQGVLGGERSPAIMDLEEQFGIEDKQLVALSAAMHLEAQAGCPGGNLYVQSISLAMVTYLNQRYGTCQGSESKRNLALPPRQLQQVFDYIDANMSRPLCLTDMAALVDLSTSYFSRLFKQSTGLTPYRYVLKQRIDLGARLLRMNSQSIADISLAIGFADQSHFTDAFRRFTGLTPASFRRQQERRIVPAFPSNGVVESVTDEATT